MRKTIGVKEQEGLLDGTRDIRSWVQTQQVIWKVDSASWTNA